MSSSRVYRVRVRVRVTIHVLRGHTFMTSRSGDFLRDVIKVWPLRVRRQSILVLFNGLCPLRSGPTPTPPPPLTDFYFP